MRLNFNKNMSFENKKRQYLIKRYIYNFYLKCDETGVFEECNIDAISAIQLCKTYLKKQKGISFDQIKLGNLQSDWTDDEINEFVNQLRSKAISLNK